MEKFESGYQSDTCDRSFHFTPEIATSVKFDFEKEEEKRSHVTSFQSVDEILERGVAGVVALNQGDVLHGTLYDCQEYVFLR